MCLQVSRSRTCLNLFERLPSRFREAEKEKEETRQTNDGVSPEGAGRSKRGVQEWKGVGKKETRGPQSGDSDGHRAGANAIGENLCNHNPRCRGQGHCVASDGSKHQ